MIDFNLIPNEFREEQHKQRTFVKLSILLAAILAAVSLSFSFAESLVESSESEVQELKSRKAISMQQQQRLSELSKRKESLESQVLLLSSLRSGAPIDELIATIETALTSTNVWFVSWQFRRAGIVVADDPEIRAPSYFVIAKDPSDFPKKWHAMTHMTIHGEAEDHAALSKFVQRLFQHPTVEDVRVQRSTREEHGVSFNLAVVVKTEGNAS